MSELSRAVQQLRKFALGHPEAREDFPWGERTIKVRGKIFVFLSQDGDKLYLTVKLPHSADAAPHLGLCDPGCFAALRIPTRLPGTACRHPLFVS